ncbi:MAG: lipopolysaccharide biosynthesis protein [Solirubrobacteraceae bacterium]
MGSEPAAAPAAGAPSGARDDGYARGARILSIGIASTGVFTFAYFAVASHVLDPTSYGAISLLWSVLFVVISVIYRPVEQLLSRTIAERRARGLAHGHPLRIPLLLQGGFAVFFVALALALRVPIEDAFDSAALYWIFVGATAAYAASYFARGYFAGHQWFGLYGGLVLFESISRFAFPVAVAVGLASGQTAVALGIVAAPLASLLVVPLAISRHVGSGGEPPPVDTQALTMRAGAGFALSVAAIQLAEQSLLNAAVLTVSATASTALAGVVFNALLITRAPLQLFQSVQTSLLPHLAGLEATEGREAFDRAIRVTMLAIAGFAGAVAIGLLAVGPFAMDLVFGKGYDYNRVGLAVIALGMGFHLSAGTLNQAALARGRARAAAFAWLFAAVLFVVWMLSPVVGDELTRAEVGYAGAAAVLCALLWRLERGRPRAPNVDQVTPERYRTDVRPLGEPYS